MRKTSIKSHLKKYSIFQKRSTTINHAFASAMAPFDEYSEATIDQILFLLECLDGERILCVYCGKHDAETWDHLCALVQDNEPSGFGHKFGNLVPACKGCNSKKGNRTWQLANDVINANNPNQHSKVIRVISHHASTYPAKGNSVDPKVKQALDEIKLKILNLMKEADTILS